MSNEVYKLLNEFSIRMNDRPERPSEEDDGEDFDFDLSGTDDEFDSEDEFVDSEYGGPDDESDFDGMDFDQDELEFGDFERGEPEDEFGDEGLPRGLDDVDSEDGEFGGERKVDITDRLKSLLSRRGETEDELDDKIDTPRSLRLSDVEDFSGGERPSARGSDTLGDMGDSEPEMRGREPEMRGRERRRR